MKIRYTLYDKKEPSNRIELETRMYTDIPQLVHFLVLEGRLNKGTGLLSVRQVGRPRRER
jgi:DNA-binding transcriptional regulator YhcF (GntR family)